MSSSTICLCLYLAFAMTWLFLVANNLVRASRLLSILGDLIMSVVRALAFAVGWIFVSVVYVPIQLFNLCNPFVPYDNSDEEEARPKLDARKKSDLSIYKVSDIDFNKRFSPATKKEDEGQGSGVSSKDSDSEWEKIEGTSKATTM